MTVIGLTAPSKHTRIPLPPQPEPSTQIEMDFEVIHHTESMARKMSTVDYWSVRKSAYRRKKNKTFGLFKSMTSRTKHLDHV